MNITESNQGDIAILVVSYDEYQDVWHPFFRCFFKHWPDCPFPIFLGSNTLTYPDQRVTSILVGPDRDYSSNLIAMLDEIKQEWIILWLEDVFLSAPVATDRIQELIRLAQREKAAHLQLHARRFTTESLLRGNRAVDGIRELPKGMPYRVTIALGLWSKASLRNLLRPGESAWEIERLGTLRSFNSTESFFYLANEQLAHMPLSFVHGVLKGKWTWTAARFLKQVNLEAHLSTRETQSTISHLYAKCYIALRYGVFRAAYGLFGVPGMTWLAFRQPPRPGVP